MKKRFIFFTLLLLTLIGGAKFNVLNAQEKLQIGEDSQCVGFNLLPNYCYYNYSITQQIYTSDELGGAPGVISTIAFRSSSTYDFSRKFKVYMLNTSKGTFEDKTDMVNMTDENLVYNGNVTYVAGGKWMVLQLNVPFNYTGENLILCVCDYSGTYKDSYNHFYVFDSGENRSLYKFTDNAAFDPSNIQGNNQQAASYQVGMDKKVNQIQFTFESSAPAEPSVTITPESINFGKVRIGDYWTEKGETKIPVTIKAASTKITDISIDNDFFKLPQNIDLSANKIEFDLTCDVKNGEAKEYTATLKVAYEGSEKPATVEVRATAYTPANGDIVEKAIEVTFTDNAFSHSATGMYDDYILPGEAEDGNLNDAVYQFTLANDAVVTANVNGTNAIAAIYKAEDLQGNGPSSDNNNTGVQNGPTGPTTFGPYTFDTSDDMNYFTYEADIWLYSTYSYRMYTNTSEKWIFTTESYVLDQNSKLSFDYCTYNMLDKVIVGVKDNNGNIISVGDGYTSSNNGYTYSSGPISLNINGEYCIGFKSVGGNNSVYIDNIQLTDGSAKSRAGEAQIDGVQYPAGTYYLVAAADGDFTLNLSTASLPAPESFAYTAPENNTIVEETNPKLSWESAKYASSYDVYLGTTKVAEDITATSFQTTGLSNNTKYNWQVVAKNSKGETKGEVYSFITPLDIPQNVTASSNEIYPNANNVTITWDAITGVKGYNVYVKANGQGSGIKNNGDELVTATSYELSNMDYSQNGHVVYVTAVYEIEGETYESNPSAAQTIKVTEFSEVSFVVTEGSNAVAGVKIVAVGTDEFGKTAEYTFYTKENGECTENILIGTYSITASKPDYKTNTIELTVNYGENVSFIALESNPSAPFAVSAEEGLVSWDAEYASYNVYRRDSEGLVKSLATEVKAEEYQDAEWETLADGEYEYGVSAMMVETSYVTETFSTTSIPEGWTQNGAYTWNFNGTYAYLFQNWTEASPSNLITPLIDLSNESAPTISFKYSIGGSWTSSGYYNTLKVEVSESLNGPWTNIFTSSSYTSGFVNVEKSLSAFAGKKVYVKFVTDTDYSTTYIDDVVLPNTTSSESRINWSAPVEKGGITFTGDGNWNDEANWSAVPNTEDKVTIKGNATITEDVTVGSIRIASGATLTVKKDVVLNVTNGISNTNAAALVMEDGAQIIQTNSNVAATFNMNIVNPQNGWTTEQKDGWQFIASPLLNAKTSAFETSGENNDFDLYKYDGTKEGAEWVNYESHKRVGDTFEHNFNDGLLNGWTNLDATNQWNIATGGIDATYCLTSANSGTSYVMSPKVLVEEGSKFYFTAKVAGYYDQNLTVAVSETGNIDDMVTKLNNISIGTSNWQYQAERYITLDEYAGKEVYIIISHTSTYGYQIAIDNLRLTNAGGVSDGTFETEFVNGRAYLASYQAETTATFTGVLNNATSFDYEVAYDAEKELANFHLLGNPFSFDMDWSGIAAEGLVDGYAVVNNQGGYDYLTSGNIKVGDGFFVKATGANASLSYNHKDVVPATRGSEKANSINVIATSKAGKDNVVVNFAGQAEGFNKLQNFNDAIATVYVSENGKNYGIANVDENTTEVALNFDAKEMGSYTISLDVNGEFETVTLVDRFTGVETNMLVEDEYSFIASNDDNVNRFVIRLAQGSQLEAQSQFVYQSGEELILSIEGSVQIVDMLGRVVYSNEHASGNNRIYVGEFNDASYVVRVINEEGVKVQKVVIY